MAGIRNTHRKLRRQWDTTITNQGGWTCRRCGHPITPGQPYDLGHPTDATPGGPTTTHGLEPEHPHCNRSAGATAGNHLRHHPLTPSRNW